MNPSPLLIFLEVDLRFSINGYVFAPLLKKVMTVPETEHNSTPYVHKLPKITTHSTNFHEGYDILHVAC